MWLGLHRFAIYLDANSTGQVEIIINHTAESDRQPLILFRRQQRSERETKPDTSSEGFGSMTGNRCNEVRY